MLAWLKLKGMAEQTNKRITALTPNALQWAGQPQNCPFPWMFPDVFFRSRLPMTIMNHEKLHSNRSASF